MSVSVVAESFFATRLIGTAFAYALLSRGLERLPASSAFSLSLLHPLTAGVLGFVAWAKLSPRTSSWVPFWSPVGW